MPPILTGGKVVSGEIEVDELSSGVIQVDLDEEYFIYLLFLFTKTDSLSKQLCFYICRDFKNCENKQLNFNLGNGTIGNIIFKSPKIPSYQTFYLPIKTNNLTDSGIIYYLAFLQ